MASTCIGLIVGRDSGTVYSLINPSDSEGDGFLDLPAHLELENVRGEAVMMVKLSRAQIGMSGPMSLSDVYRVISRWFVETSETYCGADQVNMAI